MGWLVSPFVPCGHSFDRVLLVILVKPGLEREQESEYGVQGASVIGLSHVLSVWLEYSSLLEICPK